MSVENSAPKRVVRTIWGVAGAFAGVVATIFGAGVYYQTLTTELTAYIKKIEANERAIQSLSTQLGIAQRSVATLAAFQADLMRGHVEVSSGTSSGCPAGSFMQGIHPSSQSGGEHGQIYAITVECRKFGVNP